MSTAEHVAPWTSPAEELEALRAAALRATCRVRHASERVTAHGPRAHGRIVCPDAWAAARFLVALGVEDAKTPAARAFALELVQDSDGTPAGVIRKVFEYVKSRVRFVREIGEVFTRSDYTLATGAGDCDDHARLVFALLRAAGIPARFAFLSRRGGNGPSHVVTQAYEGGAWHWLETTVDAAIGEHPYAAAQRLGLVKQRRDISTEVRTMTEKDLKPIPMGFFQRTDPAELERDVQALARLGFFCDEPVDSPSDPAFRNAVVDLQRDAGITIDGLIGPETRAAIGRALPVDDFGMGYLASLGAPSLSSHLSPAFFRGVRAMADRLRAKGASITGEDLLAVWLPESGIKNVPNGMEKSKGVVEGHAGLNQMGPQERKAAGFVGTMAEWLAMPLEDQLPFVERFYLNATGGNARALRDDASLYLVNFLPAFASHAGDPSFVLATKKPDDDGSKAWRDAHPGDWYAWNRGLDAFGKGTIIVADLGLAIAAAKRSNAAYWAEVSERYYAESGDSPRLRAVAVGTIAALLLVSSAAVAYWMVRT